MNFCYFFLCSHQGESGLKGLPGPSGKPGPKVSLSVLIELMMGLNCSESQGSVSFQGLPGSAGEKGPQGPPVRIKDFKLRQYSAQSWIRLRSISTNT